MNTSRRNKPAPDLEKALADLEAIVTRLETGELPLDKALKEFERGVKLSHDCQSALNDAEQKVRVLVDGQLAEFSEADGPENDDD